MHAFNAITLIAAASFANAQLPNLPGCSLTCFSSALGTDGCSELTDFACHCQKPILMGSVEPCVKNACDSSDQTAVSSVVVSLCSSVGHPLSVPPVEDWGSATATSISSSTTGGSGSSASNSSSLTTTSSSGPQNTSQTSSGASTIGPGCLEAILVTVMMWIL